MLGSVICPIYAGSLHVPADVFELTFVKYRHVRVHHTDKSRDDPLLRDVLAARPDGSGKVARRRRNTAN